MSNKTPDRPYTEEELHGLVDGQLSPARAAEIELHLAADPQAAARVDAWRSQNAAIRSAFSGPDLPRIAEGVPSNASGLRGWMRLAAACLLVGVLSGALGYFLGNGARTISGGGGLEGEWLAGDASAVHLTYVREVRHPVEVSADEQDHLVTWLGNRIDRAFSAPDLEELGFALLGGRLVPVGGQPGAMLMYENDSGERATIILARNTGARDTAFQFTATNGVNTLRWIDGPDAYAISGFMPREDLEAISSAVYSHFEGRYHPG